MSLQYRSNEDCYAIVCKVYHQLKTKRKVGKEINLTRIGQLDFELSKVVALRIQCNMRTETERFRLKEMGGGFIRGIRVDKREPAHGKVI